MRIISGRHRGRKILPPAGLTTRPITDRVKLALFNILGGQVEEAAVVDLFCGTGSMGLESLSRGAKFCCFADLDRPAIACLRQNIAALGEDARSRVWQGDILARLAGWLEEVSGPVHLAFVDPPYEMVENWAWPEAIAQVFGPLGRKLSPAGLVVLRCPRNTAVPETLGPLCVRKRRDYGKMSLVFLGLAAR